MKPIYDDFEKIKDVQPFKNFIRIKVDELHNEISSSIFKCYTETNKLYIWLIDFFLTIIVKIVDIYLGKIYTNVGEI